jgi:hypothetical protein
MSDVQVTQNQINVTPETSTTTINTTPVEVTVQSQAQPTVTVEESSTTLEIIQPETDLSVALAPGPQGPQGPAGADGSLGSITDLSMTGNLTVEGKIKTKLDGGSF